MKSSLFGVIDIGSNTIRSLLVETLPGGTYRVLGDEREAARLASGLTRQGKISVVAMQRAVDALGRMAQIARARPVRRLAVVATSAIRNASNRQVFVDRVRSETGLRVRVISGAEEARLAFESAAESFDLADHPCAVADVGGGSTELILGLGSHIRQVFSLRLGCVGLTEEFLRSDPIKGKEFKRLRKEILHRIQAAGIPVEIPPRFLIASGGTATTVAQMAMARHGNSGKPAQGFEVTQGELLHLRDSLVRRTLAERRQMPGLSPDRADIIVAGVAILCELLLELKVNTLKVSTRGIRHALLNRLIGRSLGDAGPASHQRRRLLAAESFARSLRFEQDHGDQVRRISVSMFDQLSLPLGLPPEGRDLLAAAALLHDVGYVISYRQHHKHSYHLIAHAHLDGFTPREREIVALVARYHRRSMPRRKHEAWGKLGQDDRKMVLGLSAILRVADALDRRHSQGVQEVRCRVRGRRVVLALVSSRDLEVEIHGAAQQAELFRKAFGKEVGFQSLPLRQASRPLPSSRKTRPRRRASA